MVINNNIFLPFVCSSDSDCQNYHQYDYHHYDSYNSDTDDDGQGLWVAESYWNRQK